MKKTLFVLASLITLSVTAIVITALVMAKKTDIQDRFSVVGSGTVYAKADIANIEIGFNTGTKKTAAEATVDSTDKMNKIVDVVKKLGIEDKDIKTSNYNLNPVYNYTSDRGQQLMGYEVTQAITLKVRDLTKIGDVIAKTTEQGANQINSISFTIDDEYVLKNQARKLAIAKAREKAAMIAAQSGIKLGKITGFSENSEPVITPMYYSNAKMSFDSAEGMASPEIQTGQNEIKVEVVLTYAVK